MNTFINNDVANRLHEISAELAKPISADAESIRRLHDIAKEITSLADSIGRHENVNIADVWKNETVEGKACRYRLPVYLGVTSADDDIVVDLAQMPHLLVGGMSMSGKSNFLNSLICGLVRHRSPDEVRFVFYDPKCVEFTAYSNLPHAAVDGMLPIANRIQNSYTGRIALTGEFSRCRYFKRSRRYAAVPAIGYAHRSGSNAKRLDFTGGCRKRRG